VWRYTSIPQLRQSSRQFTVHPMPLLPRCSRRRKVQSTSRAFSQSVRIFIPLLRFFDNIFCSFGRFLQRSRSTCLLLVKEFNYIVYFLITDRVDFVLWRYFYLQIWNVGYMWPQLRFLTQHISAVVVVVLGSNATSSQPNLT